MSSFISNNFREIDDEIKVRSSFISYNDKENLSNNIQEIKPVSNTSKVLSNLRSSWDLPASLSQNYSCDSEHLPKYSEAEHKTLLDAAIKSATIVMEKNNQLREVEWKTEKENLNKEICGVRLQLESLKESHGNAENSLSEANEQSMLARMQTKALTFRVQSLDNELVEKDAKYNTELEKLKTDQLAELQNLKEMHALQMSQLKSELEMQQKLALQQLSANFTTLMAQKDNEIRALTKQLEESNLALKEKDAKFAITLTEAVNEAKQHVYTKAEAQFAAGNAKYLAIKQQLKDKTSEHQTVCTALQEKNESFAALEIERGTLSASLECLENKYLVITGAIDYLLSGFESEAIKWVEFDGSKVKSIIEKVTECGKGNIALINDLKGQLNILANRKQALESVILEKETLIIELQNKMRQNDENYAAEQLRQEGMKKEMQTITEESKFQLTILAKLTTAKENLECQLKDKDSELNDLQSRCSKLREMNSELMQMLESMENK